MWHLFKNEVYRFRKLALAFAIGHLLILWGFSQSIDLLAQDRAKSTIGLMVIVVIALSLGLYQIGSYKRLSLWTYLVQRPLSPGRIYAALTGAGAALLFTVLVVPVWIMTLYLDTLTAQWVDLRHYLMGVYIIGIALSFYLGGCFIALSASRAAFLVLTLATFFLTREAVGLWLFLPQLVVALWLGYLAYAAFKPDLSTHLKRPLPAVMSALPIQYALYGFLIAALSASWGVGTILREHGPTGFSTFSWDNYFPAGTVPHLDYMTDGFFEHGLALEDPEASAHYLKQIALADSFVIPGPSLAHFATWQQLPVLDRYEVLDEHDRPVRWTFSHDRMLFHGRNLRTGQSAGWLGREGRIEEDATQDFATHRFEEVPHVLSDRYLMTEHRIYEVDSKRERVTLRYELPKGERWSSPFVAHSTFVIARSDRALYFFEPRDFEHSLGLVQPTAEVPIPGDADNLSRTVVAELLDSYLVTFVMGRQSARGFHDARQVVLEIGFDGSTTQIAERALTQGVPLWQSHSGFLVSPFLQTAHDVAWSLIGPHREARVTLGDTIRNPPPTPILGWAALLLALSSGLTWWLAGRRELSPTARGWWSAAAMVAGVPVLISLYWVTRRRERPVEVEASISNEVAIDRLESHGSAS